MKPEQQYTPVQSLCTTLSQAIHGEKNSRVVPHPYQQINIAWYSTGLEHFRNSPAASS